MKSIICELDKYDVIGFDLDGTLYDEFDFVKQAYKGVANVMSESLRVDHTDIWNRLNIEWLKVGSSAPVFQNVFQSFGTQEPDKAIIKDCIKAYRESPMALTLSDRARTVLDYLRDKSKTLYLITDGNSDLQRRKIDALGLGERFSYIAISGDYGKEFHKPSVCMFEKLAECVPDIQKSIYCGDRDVDRRFAASAGIDFLCLRNMCIAQE